MAEFIGSKHKSSENKSSNGKGDRIKKASADGNQTGFVNHSKVTECDYSITAATVKTSNLSGSGKPPPKSPTQNEVALIAFLAVGGRGFTTFEANSEWQCTALHSLVSQLQIKRNIMFDRELDPYTNKQGRVTNVMRYWIAQDSITTAKRLVNRYRLKRGLLPLYLIEEAANDE